MRQRGVGARRDDRLVRRTGRTAARMASSSASPSCRSVVPGSPQHFGVGERSVGERRCRLDTGQLRRILDTAQLPKKPGDGHELAVGECRSPLALLIPTDDVAFERNPGCTLSTSAPLATRSEAMTTVASLPAASSCAGACVA